MFEISRKAGEKSSWEWSSDGKGGFEVKANEDHIKGTKMAFAGLRKERDRASVILYLNQNSDNPLPLP